MKCWPLELLESTSVCVKVELCGVNFSDIYTRQGFLRQLKTPRVLGAECYGTIETIGNKVNNFQVMNKIKLFFAIYYFFFYMLIKCFLIFFVSR